MVHDVCVCDTHIVLLIRWDKVQSLQADQVSKHRILQAATQADQTCTFGTSSASSALMLDYESDQVSAPQTLPPQSPQELVCQVATDQTANVYPQIPQTATPQTAHTLNMQAGALPQCNVFALLTTSQVCTIQAAQGTLQTTQVCTLDTAQGTAFPTAQVCTLDTAQATAPQAGQVSVCIPHESACETGDE